MLLWVIWAVVWVVLYPALLASGIKPWWAAGFTLIAQFALQYAAIAAEFQTWTPWRD